MLRQNLRYIWVVAAGMVLVSCAGMTFISGRFVFGEGHAERPVVAVVVLYLFGWTGFGLGAATVLLHKRGPVLPILAVALAARLILLPSSLIQENDCYRYVLDGEALVHGVNPFAHTPEDVGTNAPEAFREALSSEDANLIRSRITYSDIPTIYPPAAQAAFALGVLITPWDWMGQRLVFFAADLVTIAALVALLRQMKRPVAWIVFYAWNPLVLKEVLNSAHVDGIAALWVVLAAYCLHRWGRQNQPGWAALAGAALALAVLAKLYPVILGPVCLAWLLRGRHGGRDAAVFLAILAGLVVLAYLPFMDVGWSRLTEGLRTYATEWRRNDGAFALLAWVFPHPRVAAAGIVAAASLLAAGQCYRAAGDFDAFLRAGQATLLTWFLFLPAPYPWYAVSLLGICALRPRSWAIVLSGAFGLYYLHFWIDYQGHGAQWHTIVEAVEHGLVWLAIMGSLLFARLRAEESVVPKRSPVTQDLPRRE